MAEALSLAEAAGIDAARMPECLAGGHADGTLLQKLYPRMVARDFAPQGYARQLLKDLEMVNEFAGALEGAGADDGRGAVAVPHADRMPATPSSTRRPCSSSTNDDRSDDAQPQETTPDEEPHQLVHRYWPLPTLVALSHRRPRPRRRRSSCATRTSAWPTRRRRCTPTRWPSWSRSAPTAASRSRCSRTRSSAASARWSTASSRGAISMGHHDFASLGKIVPATAVFNTPFVYRDAEHSMRATDARTSPALQEINKELVAGGNMRIVGSFFQGTRAAHVEGEGAVARRTCRARSTAACRSSCGRR